MTDLQAILDKGGPWKQARIIGDQLLIQGDCREVMAVVGGAYHAICTDPPYGLDKSWGKVGWQGRGIGKSRLWVGTPDWDHEAADLAFLPLDMPSIVWGGNYFEALPPQKGWLIWDKEAATLQAQAELAWTNCAPTVRVFRDSPLGVFGNGGKNRELKSHPTQKPIALMEWCLGFLPDARTILDPFMGSGTTLVACQRLGRQGIGIELDADYFEIACKRVQEVVNNPPLFTPAPPKPTQEKMDL